MAESKRADLAREVAVGGRMLYAYCTSDLRYMGEEREQVKGHNAK